MPLFFVLAFLLCGADLGATTTPPNFVVVLLDDIGTDRLSYYGTGSVVPATPNLDALFADGLLFENTVSMPMCSPTRASILTGRMPERHGIGRAVPIDDPSDTISLSHDETTIAELLRGAGYSAGVLGKWHLAASSSDRFHPILAGFQFHAGAFSNLNAAAGGGGSYKNWRKTVTLGVSFTDTQFTTKYATTDTADDAIASLDLMQEPFALWVNFNAAHSPFHRPPNALHSQPDTSTDLGKYLAMIEALDTELGRVLQAIDYADTVLCVVSDNGTPDKVSDFPQARAKRTVYDGGTHVPMVWKGPGIATGVVSFPASVCDIFATVAEMAGVDASTGEDSISLWPTLQNPCLVARASAGTSGFKPNLPPGSAPTSRGQYWAAQTDGSYRLVFAVDPMIPLMPGMVKPQGSQLFYHTQTDPHEQISLCPCPPAIGLGPYSALDPPLCEQILSQ